ncbi:uncharacterized protein [Parasteatoda tepidariorum]|uniref:uncharacterized protein n=1 Tax=Parasteatoda tepidariorum TaxID=114398 RepID=UPI0039BC71AA
MKDLADHVRSHPENIVNRYDEAMHRITTERFSIQSFRLTTLLEASKYDLNDFHIIPDSVGFSIVGIAFRKHFPHMEKVNRIIHRVTESGIYYKKIEDMMFWAKLKGRHQSPKRVVRALSFEDVDAQLMVLIIGFVLSSCCLFAEILYKKYSAAV